jgi:hypothetical protein
LTLRNLPFQSYSAVCEHIDHGIKDLFRSPLLRSSLTLDRFNILLDMIIVVIVLGMRSAKKKPLTKKEREEKRKKHKEKKAE